jgi:hypothetical protein
MALGLVSFYILSAEDMHVGVHSIWEASIQPDDRNEQ